ncbi:hypothetical protein [uncultured Ruegeria sp.]|uniref:hypothetical protein n=1 Tax=uncultured Ruegeria sp. TaxID=259304 RepID=UPI002629C1FF|nr:hypothetical protein [uncultured Ruegeria sp.]
MSKKPDVENPAWPPGPYNKYPEGQYKRWLTFEKQFPQTGRPSRRASHIGVPYSAVIEGASEVTAELLGEVAANYLRHLQKFLEDYNHVDKGLDLPESWERALFPSRPSLFLENYIQWLPVWPAVGKNYGQKPEFIGSWNLSRDTKTHELPATIILTAAEGQQNENRLDVFSYNVGLRIPMAVERSPDGLKVTIRTMTAELPLPGYTSFSEQFFSLKDEYRESYVNAVLGFTSAAKLGRFDADIASSSGTSAETVVVEEIWPRIVSEESLIRQGPLFSLRSKARASKPRAGTSLGFQVQSEISGVETTGPDLKLIISGTTKHELVTHAVHNASVFVQTPSGWHDASDPPAQYDWTLRRPPRDDAMLVEYFVDRPVPAKLEGDGFEIRLCPKLVPEDRPAASNGETVKTIPPAKLGGIPPRSNEFAALNAYCNAADFFRMLSAFGIVPDSFVIHAQKDIGIFYRAGITPGPGGGGRTINAQVKYDPPQQPEIGAEKPAIEMNLALANLNRWDRPVQPDGRRKWAEPLGIASSGRWMLHEFSHYLLAARIGQLEFDFCHSPGDGMAAVAFDPISRLADTRDGVANSFRGVTYPFVFSTRRHDRTPLLGWAWYGTLNRSVLETEPSVGFRFKSYLTEQILSSTLFRLYRALGGDTYVMGNPGQGTDQKVRERASFVTLYLLVRAIDGFAQSPSMAEFLQTGMQESDVGTLSPLPIVDYRFGGTQPVEWRGGLANKVVRWAFEAQGMFPPDPAKPHNGIGVPPEVDIYVADRRPETEDTSVGPVEYGPGSYRPVSLDWGADPLWLMTNAVVFGNRGSVTAENVELRIWIGKLSGDPSTPGWDENPSSLKWEDRVFSLPLGDIASGVSTQTDAGDLDQEVQDAMATKNAVLLFEISCADDHANTDPAKALPVALEVEAGDVTPNLPGTPRALTDLVATDNNLGLWRG